MKKNLMPIPKKPVSLAEGEKAMLWILRNAMPKGYGGRKVSFEQIDWNKSLIRDSLGLGRLSDLQRLLPPAPMEITIRLRILEKGKHYF